MKVDKKTHKTLEKVIRNKLFGTKFNNRNNWTCRLVYWPKTSEYLHAEVYITRPGIDFVHKISIVTDENCTEKSLKISKDFYERVDKRYYIVSTVISDLRDSCVAMCREFFDNTPKNLEELSTEETINYLKALIYQINNFKKTL